MSQSQRDAKGRLLPGHRIRAYSEDKITGFFQQYCRHRAYGFDKESFSPCHYETVERYAIKSWQASEDLRRAEAMGWFMWELVIRHMAFGWPVEIPDRSKPGGRSIVIPNRANVRLLLFIIQGKMRAVYGRSAKLTIEPERYKPSPIRIVRPENCQSTM